MASLSSPPPHLAHCTPYCTSDPVLGHVLVFFNPHSLSSSTSVSRIEAHILTCAGLQSYPKLTLSPSSPLYAAVNHLPLQKRDLEVYRGLAIAVLKYFSELPKTIKETILKSRKSNVLANDEGQAVAFDEMHAGDLAARLKELESESLFGDVSPSLAERFMTWLDVDVVLRPPGNAGGPEAISEEAERLLGLFGEPTHLPFTKLKRTQSRPASARPRPPKDSAEGIERELEQLRLTEASYVGKLQDLLDNLVKPLRGRASQKKGDGGFPNGRDLEALFPPSLDQILELNMAFLEEVEKGGLPEVADCFLRRFPDFKEPYEEYIQASSEFPQLLGRFAKDRHSSFSKRVQKAGEQKLRSMIIEPVQRLPRYTLLIDSIINLLAFDDPSLPKLIDAREIITEICSLQSSDKDERSKTTKRLQSIVVSWPPLLRPPGRLITAFDFLDVLPPFNDRTSEAIPSTILLFPDRLLILRRPKHTSMQARAIMAEVDKPGGGGGVSNYGSGTKRDGLGCDLQFAGWIDLADVRFAESDGGEVIWMTLARDLKDSWDVRAGGMGIRRMRLLNAYEGRATKLSEDIVKARLEGRISSGRKGIIGLRETKAEGLGLWACVWGSEDRYAAEGRKGSVVVYIDDGASGGGPGKTGRELAADVGKGGVDIAVNVEAIMGTKLRVEFRSWNEYSSTDTVSREEFSAVFTKRVSSIIRLHSLPQHPPLTAPLMSANRKLLRSLGVPFDGESRFSRLRPPSPVKLLSSVFGSSSSNTPSTPGSPSKSRQLMDRTQSQMLPPKMLDRSSAMLQKRSTVLGIMGDWNGESDDGEMEISLQSITMPSESPLKKLEQTLESFVKALRKLSSAEDSDLMPLRNMQGIDDAAVEEFLGLMLGDPRAVKFEERMGIDIVFDALRRFLRRDWKDGMGSVIGSKGLVELRAKSDTLYPGDFEDFFKIFVLDWAPQNKRAFKTLVLLLKDMQDKVENPDDKGLLTKAFTELLVEDKDPLEFMPLVDRLVEEAGNLFSESLIGNGGEFSLANGNGTLRRNKSVHSGSNYSTASFRKRFGLSHTSSARDPARGEHQGDSPKGASVWRTLSKNSRREDLQKGHILRSKSTDYDARTYHFTRRPTSRDRPTALSTFTPLPPSPSSPMRPLSATSGPTPGSKPLPPGPTVRKKRRSSLSDLTTHRDYEQILPVRVSPDLEKIATPTLTKSSISGLKDTEDYRGAESPSPSQLPKPIGGGTPSRRMSKDRSEIPVRKSLGNPVSAGPQRLKMQSTQKLRERLQSEKQAITMVDQSLQLEIDKIGEELSLATRVSSRGIKELSLRLEQVEARLPQISELNAKHGAFEKRTGEALAKKDRELEFLDKNFNDCLNENDVMFEKFNEELVKISGGLKAGRDADLLSILQEVKAEQAKLRRQNMKLRRENSSLRGQLGDG